MITTNATRRAASTALVMSIVLLAARALPADDPPAPPAPAPAAPAAPTAQAVREPLRIEVSLGGGLEAERKAEVFLEPEAWTGFVVEKAAAPGEKLKKGDPIVAFKTDKLDDEIRDLKAAQELSALGLEQSEEDYRAFKEALPLDLAAATRAKRNADEDLKTYLEVDGPLAERSNRKSVEGAKYGLEYASEELRQLEKMYKADEITEDTEEIILTRARREVENAKFYLETATIRSDQSAKVGIPRQKEALEEAARRQAMAFEKATSGLMRLEAKKRLELAKAKGDHEKSAIRLAKLERDRGRMTVASPQDGIVYYGGFRRGHWADPAAIVEEMRPGASVTVAGRKLLCTVVDPRPLTLRADLPEKDLLAVRPGVEGFAAPPSLPGVRPKARVDWVSAYPMAPGLFDVRIHLDLGDDAKSLVPGMDCPVKLLSYENPAAITVPTAALLVDGSSGDGPHLYIQAGDGKVERRAVVTGRRTEAKVEVLEGVREGETVLLRRPPAEGGAPKPAAPALGAGEGMIGAVLVAVLTVAAGPEDAAAAAAVPSAPAAAPAPAARSASPAEMQRAMDRGIAFLLATQNSDGSWGSARNTKNLNIYAPVPGAHLAFRSGVTGLCVAALIEAAPPGDGVRRAIDRGEEWLLRELPRLRRATGDAIYNVWGHAYGIQALVRVLGRHRGEAEVERRVKEVIRRQIDLLGRYETLDGGWCYYDFVAETEKPSGSTISFVSATVLVALREAQDAGVPAPSGMIERAIASIHRQEKPDFSYLYGEYLKWRPQRGINQPGGSLGRSQACNLALRVWGDPRITDDVLRNWLHRLHDRNLWLDIGRKRPIPHESYFQVAGYFYYYGHYYAARCLELLPAGERAALGGPLAAILLSHQEKDGSWWDFPFYNYHQPYGTAFAVMTLKRCIAVRSL